AGMAHEINNPLAGMMQTANVLASRLTGDLPANARAAEQAGVTMVRIHAFMEARAIPKMLKRLHASGARAAEIVTNMLCFARKSDDTASNHNLAELLDKCVELSSVDYDLKKKYDFRQIEIIRAILGTPLTY
ncbi:MAG: histidine kinase, partial [Deltaproteobacteria bacterium]|nr:histidine kinase [Deltaproteobacteria bacterium]